jgi:hypothetical protein
MGAGPRNTENDGGTKGLWRIERREVWNVGLLRAELPPVGRILKLNDGGIETIGGRLWYCETINKIIGIVELSALQFSEFRRNVSVSIYSIKKSRGVLCMCPSPRRLHSPRPLQTHESRSYRPGLPLLVLYFRWM